MFETQFRIIGYRNSNEAVVYG